MEIRSKWLRIQIKLGIKERLPRESAAAGAAVANDDSFYHQQQMQ